MSAPLSPDDAEKAIVDNNGLAVTITFPPSNNSSPSVSRETSEAHMKHHTKPLPPLPPPGLPLPATAVPKELKPPAKRKPRASRWIRFQLWFNTYRYAEHCSISSSALIGVQQILHLCDVYQSRWHNSCSEREMGIPSAVHWRMRSR